MKQLDYSPLDSMFPLQGLNTLAPSNESDPRFSPDFLNLVVKDGFAAKRRGYRHLGTEIAGIDTPVLDVINFQTMAGVDNLIAVTTRRIYKLDTSTDTWQDINPTFDIDGVDTGADEFTITGDGDLSLLFPDGGEFIVDGSTGNDETYTISSTSFSSPNFTISVNENITDGTADGTVSPSWTGDESNTLDHTVGVDTNGKFIFITNGLNYPLKWDGSGNFESAGFNLSNFETCKTLSVYKDHLILGSITASGTDEAQSVYWSDTIDFTEFTTGNAGSSLLPQAQGNIQVMEQLGDRLAIYAQDSIDLMSFVGGDVLFAFDHVLNGTRLLSPRSIANIGSFHIFMSEENFLLFDGSRLLRPFGDSVKEYFQNFLDLNKNYQAHAFVDKPKSQAFFVFPTSLDHRILLLRYDVYRLSDIQWSPLRYSNRPISFGYFIRDESLLWNSSSLTGLNWNDMDFSWDDATIKEGFPVRIFGGESGKIFINDELNPQDDGVDFESFYDTIDFDVPQQHLSLYARWLEIEMELKGSGVDVYYSTDNGGSYTLAESKTLTSGRWLRYRTQIDVKDRSLRIRLRGDSSSKHFQLRWLRCWFRPGGPR